MLGIRHMARWLHQTSPLFEATASKSLLGKLRRATGYSFANCRKALDLHGNDLEKAEKWLHEQAQAMGWSKATKLEGRKTAEGLVAVSLKGRCGAMVEINCETDFVARNQTFKDLAKLVARVCLEHAQNTTSEGAVTKTFLDKESLSALRGPEGKTLADVTALAIGLVGENMTLRRAALVTAHEGVALSGCAHPTLPELDSVMLGKYGCLLAAKGKPDSECDNDPEKLLTVSQQLCQHIVGMNPQKIGTLEDKPSNDKDNEQVLIHQEFVLDDTMTVGEFLEDEGVDIVDFIRYECGADVDEEKKDNLESVEARG